jgi:hypothetical protein
MYCSISVSKVSIEQYMFCSSLDSLSPLSDIGTTSILQLQKERGHYSMVCSSLASYVQSWPPNSKEIIQMRAAAFCHKMRSNLTMFCSPLATSILRKKYKEYPM